jgi:hypothetical protein
LQKSKKHIEIISKSCVDDLKIGFKLESGYTKQQLIESALDSLKNNRLDAVIANHLENVDHGPVRAYWVDTQGTIIDLEDNFSMAKLIEKRLSQVSDD